MATTIKLKFTAKCAECGASLPVGSKARYYGRGRTYGIGCHAAGYPFAARAEVEGYDHDTGEYQIPFADPGGNSALRAAAHSNPRNLPCPTCKRPDMLTPADRAQSYQCNLCADAEEGVGY